MPISTFGVRDDDDVLGVVLERTAFATKESGFDSERLLIPTTELSANFKRQTIENESVLPDDGGAQENTPGLAHPDSQLTATVYADGLDTVPADTETATETALMRLVASSFGKLPVYSTTSKVLAAPAPTNLDFTEDVADAHALGDTVALQDPTTGRWHVRRIAAYSSGAITLDVELPFVPATDAQIQGGGVCPLNPSAAEVYLQGDVITGSPLGSPTSRDKEFFGAPGNLSVPEIPVGQPQTLSFTHTVSKFTRFVDKAQVSPASERPAIAAGIEGYIAHRDETTYRLLKFHSLGFELNREYTPDPRSNSDVDVGVGGYIAKTNKAQLVIYVHDKETLPAGFATATNFFEAWELGGDENRWKAQIQFGQKLGDINGFNWEALQLAGEPEEVDLNGVAALKLMFNFVSGHNGTMVTYFQH